MDVLGDFQKSLILTTSFLKIRNYINYLGRARETREKTVYGHIFVKNTTANGRRELN